MNLKPSPTHSSRAGGCTLTGALSVTTQVRDAVTVIHGPKGCAHHNFSLFHATSLDNGRVAVPDLVSSSLTESDIVFGGEEALFRTLQAVSERDISAIFVLSTCVVDTIGDDVDAVCNRGYPVPVLHIPTAGFLGGTFQDGVNKALMALSRQARPSVAGSTVNLVGEKNLEYEVDENYAEVTRLLSHLGLTAGLRFVHDIGFDDIETLGSARLNILRDRSLLPVGEYLKDRFGTPYIPAFPAGLSGTLDFIGTVATACGIDGSRALEIERALQAEVLADFADIGESEGFFSGLVTDPESAGAAYETATALHIQITSDAEAPHLPVQPVVGTGGVRRLLHRWRRSLHA